MIPSVRLSDPSQELQPGAAWTTSISPLHGPGIAVWVGVLVLGALGTWSVVESFASMPGEEAHDGFMRGFLFFGCALALAQARSAWLEPVQGRLRALSQAQFCSLTAVVGITLGLLLYWCGMRQFGGYDHSGVIEAGWRLVQGQRPYVDFPCTVPAAFLLGAGYAFKLFGVSWRALIVFTALFSVAMFFWSVWLAVRVFGQRGFALLLALTVQALSMLLFSYWWYNPITSASAAVFLLSAALLWRNSGNWPSRVCYAAALTLLALMKPNMAGVLIIVVSAVFFLSNERRLEVLLMSTAAFVGFLVILWANHLGLVDLLRSYLAVRSYGASTGDVTGLFHVMTPGVRWASFLAAAASLLPALLAGWNGRSGFFERGGWIGIAGILAGGCAFLVNGDTKLVDIVPTLIGSILVAAPTLRLGSAMQRLVVAIFLVLGFGGTGMAISRDRVKSIGYGRFFQYKTRPAAMEGGFFDGVHTGQSFNEVLEQTRAVLQTKPKSTVFFGPRMQWAYAAFKKPSPTGQPMIWAPGAFFPRAEMPDRLGSFVEHGFEVVILRKNDLIYYPPEMLKVLLANYWCDQSYSRLTVGTRKSSFQAPINRTAAQSPSAGKQLTGDTETIQGQTMSEASVETERERRDSGETGIIVGYGGWLDCISTIMPHEVRHWFLADEFIDKGEIVQAVPELVAALRREFPDTLDGLAWVRVERLPGALANGAASGRLIELAERACKMTRFNHAALVGILGAAYAQAGRFDEAARLAQKARKLAELAGDKERALRNQERARLIKARITGS
ncbi:MAG: hypothetical protein C5B50_28890 [Verrucomicrobia bacterium]|nr:MAG: hypothetical protein C5B50_28890 [Verrucomicrobiota bacterium]